MNIPRSADQLASSFSGLDRRRVNQPVRYEPDAGRWNVYRYADVAAVLNSPRIFVEPDPEPGELLAGAAGLSPERRKLANALFSLACSARAVAGLAPRISATAERLLTEERGAGALQVLHDLAEPLTQDVFAALLAVPEADLARFGAWLRALGPGRVTARGTLRRGASPAAAAAADALCAYLGDLVSARVRTPGDDLVSRLLAAELSGQRLTKEEVAACCCAALVGGQATLTALICNAAYCLSESPDVVGRLGHRPAPIYSTVDEVLRYLPPILAVERTAAVAATVAGEPIPAGGRLRLWLVAANHDPAQFSDPDRLNIDRVPNRHLSLGHASLALLGAALVRQEAAAALAALATLPALAPADARPPATVGDAELFAVSGLTIALHKS